MPPDHLYLATYRALREEFGADALIHFGTHGTQEWLPGKDRGLAVGDYPFLALGDLPVFYPYIGTTSARPSGHAGGVVP